MQDGAFFRGVYKRRFIIPHLFKGLIKTRPTSTTEDHLAKLLKPPPLSPINKIMCHKQSKMALNYK